jgi:hypothetical protein
VYLFANVYSAPVMAMKIGFELANGSRIELIAYHAAVASDFPTCALVCALGFVYDEVSVATNNVRNAGPLNERPQASNHRNSYVCSYMYDFIELVMAHMDARRSIPQ